MSSSPQRLKCYANTLEVLYPLFDRLLLALPTHCIRGVCVLRADKAEASRAGEDA